MPLTIPELAHAVGKSENYVRQHIFRKHLTVQKDGRNISIALDEASRWASERKLPFEPPANTRLLTKAAKKRTARMTVLTLHRPERALCNLLTVVRHRRQDALGPWSKEPSMTWTSEDFENGLRLSSLDAPLEHCQALVHDILETATLTIDGEQIDYTLERNPRRHWAFRDERGLEDASMVSPFPRYSAEIIEYWCLATKPSGYSLDVLNTHQGHAPLQCSRLGFPLDRFKERVGNLMVVGAEDAIACDLAAGRDRTLRLRVDADELPPSAYRATIWASHAGNEVLRQELAITQRLTEIGLASDVDHIGFAIFRTIDGQCIDLMEVHLTMHLKSQIRVSSSEMRKVHDQKGRVIHEVSLPSPSSTSTIDLGFEKKSGEIDTKIRQLWLERRVRELEAATRREGNFKRFGPDAFNDAARYFTYLISRDADQKTPFFLADPYFVTHLKDNAEKDTDLKKFCLDVFAATAGSPLQILCAKKEQNEDDSPPWWSVFSEQWSAHVRVRSFLNQDRRTAGFHDRFLITPKREIIITHSINGWQKDGVTFASLPYGVYRAEAERLWNMDIDSPTADLLVREISP